MIDGMGTRELQYLLNQQGAKLTLDGIDGAKTGAAVDAFVRGSNKAKPSAFRRKDTIYLAAEQLFMAMSEPQCYYGDIDGLDGPDTEQGRLKWMAGPWRQGMQETLPTDKLPIVSQWPQQSEANLTKFYGNAATNIITATFPYPMTLSYDIGTVVTRFSVNKRCADAMCSVFEAVLDHYGMTEIVRLGLNLYGGCFNNRPMRGSSRLSTHAWGCAIDMDTTRNQLRWDHTRAQMAKPEYAPFVKLFTQAGAVSLGKSRDYDWMHFQFATL